MDAQNLIRLLLSYEFDKAIRIQVCLGTRVGREIEFADIVFDALSFEVLFGTANPCNFGMGVDNRGYSVVVDVSMSRLDVFDGSNT